MHWLHYLTELPRHAKRTILISVDSFLLTMAAIVAVWLRVEEIIWPPEPFTYAVFLLPLIAIPIFLAQGMYRVVVRHISHTFTSTLINSIGLTILAWGTAILMMNLEYPRSAIIVTGIFALVSIAGSRLIARKILFIQNRKQHPVASKTRVVIYGAGSAGCQLYTAILKIPHVYAVGFIDDDKNKQHSEIAGARVYPRDAIQDLIDDKQITEIYLAIPSMNATRRKELINELKNYPLKVSTMPGIDQIMSGKVSFADLREVDIQDLLGREPIKPKTELLTRCIEKKSVMVTGAGGSIGSELCRQIVQQKPKNLVLFELSEYALYTIHQELSELIDAEHTTLTPILGSVQDSTKLARLFDVYKVETVYHAAAYKHVPMVEHNIAEGFNNNTIGTLSTAEAAARAGVEHFVLVSTDKAVRPTNFMGASKRMAELALQALQEKFSKTTFSMVRFGNVLGSSGSVIPLFRQQIAQGGPLTVTHKEMTRYFMTIPEAASLVIQAGCMAKGGDVFVLDMGEPVKINELAKQIIQLSGFSERTAQNPNGDIEIVYTGLRPGEKLYEELLIGNKPSKTEHPRIMKATENRIPYNELMAHFEDIQTALDNYDFIHAKLLMSKTVKGFHHESALVDYLKIEKSNVIPLAV